MILAIEYLKESSFLQELNFRGGGIQPAKVFLLYGQVFRNFFVQFWDEWKISTIHIYYHWSLGCFVHEIQNLNWIKLNRFFLICFNCLISFVSTVSYHLFQLSHIKKLFTMRTRFVSHAGSSSQSPSFSATCGFAESLLLQITWTGDF